jgi:hypothetical protein
MIDGTCCLLVCLFVRIRNVDLRTITANRTKVIPVG